MSEPDFLPHDPLVNMMAKQIHHRIQYDRIYRDKGFTLLQPTEYGNLDNPQVQAEIRELAGYAIEELYEAIGLLKNKKWKQTPRHTEPDEFYKELADAWHFWLELMIVAGMDVDKIQKYYFKEAAKNDARRENGY